MDKIEHALNILEKNKLDNISIINFMKNNRVLSVDVNGNSVLVVGESDRRWMFISCKNKDELYLLKNKLNSADTNFAAIDDWMIPILIEGKEVMWDLSTVSYYLPEEINLPIPQYKTKILQKSHAEIVYKNSIYKDYISLEYVIDRISKGLSAGIFENNNLVSWGITQEDGAIGFLHTINNFRRKRYGYNVTLSIIEKLRNIGKLPFAYAETNNEKSIRLLSKLGFKRFKNIHWFHVK